MQYNAIQRTSNALPMHYKATIPNDFTISSQLGWHCSRSALQPRSSIPFPHIDYPAHCIRRPSSPCNRLRAGSVPSPPRRDGPLFSRQNEYVPSMVQPSHRLQLHRPSICQDEGENQKPIFSIHALSASFRSPVFRQPTIVSRARWS